MRGVLRAGTSCGALHLGPRPTFKGSPPTIELHLLDFDGDVYGEEVRVDFVQYLREVRPFTTVAALVEQMREDVEAAAGAADRGRGREVTRLGWTLTRRFHYIHG